MESTIPFSGFYESRWSLELDDAEVYLAEGLTGVNDSGDGEEGFKGLNVADITNALFWVASYRVAQESIAEDYTENFAALVDGVCGWPTRIKFGELNSPREYNFTTDRIFVKLPRSTVRRMRKEVDNTVFVRIARETFTSRPGFISFYPNNPYEWGPLDRWDANMVGTLLQAWIKTVGVEDSAESDICEAMRSDDVFDRALDSCFVMDELKARVQLERSKAA